MKIGSADPGRNQLSNRDVLQTFPQATPTVREVQAALTAPQ